MTISSLFIFFYKKILRAQKAPNAKQTTFTLSEKIARAKNCSPCCFVG